MCILFKISSGWTVNVKASEGADLSETYYVRVPGRQEAEQAVRDRLASPSHVIEARLPIQSTVFDALGIPVGGILLKVL